MWGRGSVARESEFKSEDPGFNPLVGQGEEQFLCSSESALVKTCLCLIPLRVYSMHPHYFVRTLMITYPSVEKRVGLTTQPVVWTHENTAYRGKRKRKKLGSAYAESYVEHVTKKPIVDTMHT